MPSEDDPFARTLPGGPLLHVDADCPQLRVLAPDSAAYTNASAALFGVFGRFATRVEAGSTDEAFLDTRATRWSSIDQLAATVRRAVQQEVGLPVTVGAGRTRLMARLASRSAKPVGLRVIQPAEERRLRPTLRIEELWGIGETTQERLRQHNVRTVGDLALVHPDLLRDIAGTSMAKRLTEIAAGTDDATVRAARPRRSFSVKRVVPRGAPVDVDGLAEELAGRLQDGGFTCTVVAALVLYAGNLEHRGRARLLEPTAAAGTLASTIGPLVAEATARRIERVGITVSGLHPAGAAVQLTLDTGLF